jgi:hypothetical protein
MAQQAIINLSRESAQPLLVIAEPTLPDQSRSQEPYKHSEIRKRKRSLEPADKAAMAPPLACQAFGFRLIVTHLANGPLKTLQCWMKLLN